MNTKRALWPEHITRLSYECYVGGGRGTNPSLEVSSLNPEITGLAEMDFGFPGLRSVVLSSWEVRMMCTWGVACLCWIVPVSYCVLLNIGRACPR